MAKAKRQFWLMKSEPEAFSIDHLASKPAQVSPWDGVRNYQARNFMMAMAKGDLAFFYHSSCPEPGIYGVVSIAKEAYPDFTQFDKKSKYFDAKSNPDQPRWHMVDVHLEEKWKNPVLLSTLREDPRVAEMVILRRGNRLSITPVEEKHWRAVLSLR